MFARYNILSEDDLWMAAQKTSMYLDTLPTKHDLGLGDPSQHVCPTRAVPCLTPPTGLSSRHLSDLSRAPWEAPA
jgi:hypothetical protein